MDAAGTRMALKFLTAVNSLFEEGFLSHEKITSSNSPILQGMETGYHFFTGWVDPLLKDGTYIITCILALPVMPDYWKLLTTLDL